MAKSQVLKDQVPAGFQSRYGEVKPESQPMNHARASRPGGFDLRGVAERAALSVAGVPDPVAGFISGCQTRPLVAEAGTFAMAEETGLGPSLDKARLERM